MARFRRRGIIATGRREPYEEVVLADSPYRYLWLNELAANAAPQDSSGNGRHLMASVNIPATERGLPGIPGSRNFALSCDNGGANNGRIVTTNHNFPIENGSVELWYKAGAILPANMWLVNADADSGTGLRRLRIGLDGAGSYNCNVPMSGGIVNALATAPTDALDGDWHHVVLTYEFGGGVTNLLLFHDGLQVAAALGRSGAVTWGDLDGEWHGLGGPPTGNSGGSNWAGVLDEYAEYDYVLSPAQILAHYEAGA